jgi:hypothetical protein
MIKTLPKRSPVPEATPPPAGSSPLFQWPNLPKLGTPLGKVVGAGALGLGLLLVVGLLLLTVHWAWLGHGNAPIVRWFARIAVLARLAGIDLRASETARQGTAKVAQKLPQAQANALRQLNTAYERISYGPAISRPAVERSRQQWRQIRGALVRRILMRPWRRSGE